MNQSADKSIQRTSDRIEQTNNKVNIEVDSDVQNDINHQQYYVTPNKDRMKRLNKNINRDLITKHTKSK